MLVSGLYIYPTTGPRSCKPVISSNTSNQEQTMYWSMLSAGWNESSKNTLLDLVIGQYKDKKKHRTD